MPLPIVNKALAESNPQLFMQQVAARATVALKEAVDAYNATVDKKVASIDKTKFTSEEAIKQEEEGIRGSNAFGPDDTANAMKSAFADLQPLSTTALNHIENYYTDVCWIEERVMEQASAMQVNQTALGTAGYWNETEINKDGAPQQSEEDNQKLQASLKAQNETPIIKVGGALTATLAAMDALLPEEAVYRAREKANASAPAPRPEIVAALDRGFSEQEIIPNNFLNQTVKAPESKAANTSTANAPTKSMGGSMWQSFIATAKAAHQVADAFAKELDPRLKDDHFSDNTPKQKM